VVDLGRIRRSAPASNALPSGYRCQRSIGTLLHFSAAINEPGSGARGLQDLWLLCRAGSSLCALPLANVVEIMRALRVEPVAGAPPFVRGLSVIRGAPTPVVDIAHLFGGCTAPSRRWVTVKTGTRVVALAVDSVLGVRSVVTASNTEPLPPLLREAMSDMVSVIRRLDADLLMFLNTARIVAEVLLEHLGDPETFV
jgi:purine-binding chemotaxis protein CheW